MKRLIAEFEQQSFIQIIFPHKESDWVEYLDEAQECFISIINTIIKFQKCLVVCDDIKSVQKHFTKHKNLFFVEYLSDDTWARDTSALSIEESNKVSLLNFNFNAWGGKFEASRDNAMNNSLKKCYLAPMVDIDFTLEGGAIESNAEGLLLTTAACMLNKNRNPQLSKEKITKNLQKYFGSTEILYLHHGYLAGDDTDSHIDTLARFIDTKSIMYVQCRDKDDEHYKELLKMEDELKIFAQKYKLNLIPLPMPDALYYNDERLPATYANFLLLNGAVIVPLYGTPQDSLALEIFQTSFKDRDVIGLDCRLLIRQHGSLHCVTMNFAATVELAC